jgi:phage-related protein
VDRIQCCTALLSGSRKADECGSIIALVDTPLSNMTTLNRQWPRGKTPPVSWIKAALKEFQEFPGGPKAYYWGRSRLQRNGKADIVKPLHGFGPGVFEIALAFKRDAFRVVYAFQLADEIWVIHAFQKKSKQGIKTPKREIDLVKDRLKRLKEAIG